MRVFDRGLQSLEGQGLGTDKPADLEKDDDEFEAYRKRMMLAYRFRPNPLVTNAVTVWRLCFYNHFCWTHYVLKEDLVV